MIITKFMQSQSKFLRARALAIAVAALGLVEGCNAVPRVQVSPQRDVVTSEDGATATLSVSLARRPTQAVDVVVTSSNTNEGTVSKALLRFDASNWSTVQTVIVQGVDDAARDGDVTYDVSFEARIAGRPETQLTAATVHVVNRDNEDEATASLQIIEPIGQEYGSYVFDISADGTTLVGGSSGPGGSDALRWTAATGTTALGGPSAEAHAISPDGSIVAGFIRDVTVEGQMRGVRWRGDAPYEVIADQQSPGPQPLFSFLEASVVLDDGTVFGSCIQHGAYGEPLACRSSTPAQIDLLGGSYIYDADATGHWAGSANAERHAPQGSQAKYNGDLLPFPAGVYCAPNTGCFAEARAFSTNGVVVGTSRIPEPGAPPSDDPSAIHASAFVYTEAGGTDILPDLEGGQEASGAYAVSRDGRLIGGYASDDVGVHAVFWIEGAPVLLEDLFRDQGGTLPAGVVLTEVRAISADARVFAVNGTVPQAGARAFRVELVHSPLD